METEKMLFLAIVSSTHSLYSLWDALSSLPLSPNDFPSSANRGEKSLSIYHLLDLLVSPSHSSLYSTLWYKRYTVTKMDIRMSITSHFIIMLPLTFPSLSSVFGMTSLRPREITKHSWRDRTKKMSRERERIERTPLESVLSCILFIRIFDDDRLSLFYRFSSNVLRVIELAWISCGSRSRCYLLNRTGHGKKRDTGNNNEVPVEELLDFPAWLCLKADDSQGKTIHEDRGETRLIRRDMQRYPNNTKRSRKWSRQRWLHSTLGQEMPSRLLLN